jgi:DNA-directed RNA polymerase specialized sigma24 family protein
MMDGNLDPNSLLQRFYAAPDAESERLLDQLAFYCRGVIGTVLRRKVGEWDEADEMATEVVVSVIRALRKSRIPGESRIKDCTGYARIVATNAFNNYVRAKRPALYRYKDRVLYVLDCRAGPKLFARWQQDAGWLGGLFRWRGSRFRATEQYVLFLQDRHEFCRSALGDHDAAHIPLPELMARFFPWVGTPVEVGDLTLHLAALQCVEDTTTVSLQGLMADAGYEDRLPATGPDPAREVLEGLSQKSFRQRLWEEISELPPLQRAALLLGMERDEVLLASGGVGALQTALSLDDNGLLAVWNALPLADGTIAQRIAVTTKQVSNLRKCARERLARRMHKCEV